MERKSPRLKESGVHSPVLCCHPVLATCTSDSINANCGGIAPTRQPASPCQTWRIRRTLIFNLHNAFVQTLQQKAIFALAKETLDYYDKVLSVSRVRFKAGDIARV